MGKVFGLTTNITRELDGFFGGRDLSAFPPVRSEFGINAAAPTTAVEIDLGLPFPSN